MASGISQEVCVLVEILSLMETPKRGFVSRLRGFIFGLGFWLVVGFVVIVGFRFLVAILVSVQCGLDDYCRDVNGWWWGFLPTSPNPRLPLEIISLKGS